MNFDHYCRNLSPKSKEWKRTLEDVYDEWLSLELKRQMGIAETFNAISQIANQEE